MAVFRFRMQSILDMKEKMEQQSKNEFAQAQKELLDEEEEMQKLRRKEELLYEEGMRLRQSTIEIQEILDNKKAIEHVKGLIEQQRLAVVMAEKKVDAATKRMMDARVQTKTYEKLREKALAEYQMEENKKENKEVDELNSYRFGQKPAE